MRTNKLRVTYNVPMVVADMAEKGWLPTHLAAAAGLSDMTIGRFLSGEVQTAPTAKKIAGALRRSIRRYIVTAEGQTAHPQEGSAA